MSRVIFVLVIDLASILDWPFIPLIRLAAAHAPLRPVFFTRAVIVFVLAPKHAVDSGFFIMFFAIFLLLRLVQTLLVAVEHLGECHCRVRWVRCCI